MYGAMGPQQVRDAVQAGELSKADAFDIIHGNKADAEQSWANRDNGVNAWQDFGMRMLVKNAELLNRAGEETAHLVGAGQAEDWFRTNADAMQGTGQGKFGDVNPSMNQSVHAAVADGVGTLLASTPALAASEFLEPLMIGAGAVGKLATLGRLAVRAVPMAVQFAATAAADGRDNAF